MTATSTETPTSLTAVWESLVVAEDKLPTIQQILAAVKREVGPVGKTERNNQQKFDYRGIDNVVNATAPALDKYGVLTIPELLTEAHDTVEVGQNRTVMGYSRVKVCYHFQGPRGDEVQVIVPGEAMDSGDKAISKAMSVAFRIALIQALNLPTNEPDADSQSYERSSRDERDQSWRDQPPVNRPQSSGNGHHANSQRANGTGNGHQPPPPAPSPPPPLADDDDWKDRIADVASRDEANMLFTEIVGLHNAGTIDSGRRSLLEAHLRWHMAHPPARNSEQAADPELPAEPERPAAAGNPPETGEQNPWATQPDFNPLDGSAPAPDTSDSTDWEVTIRQILREAQHPDALNGIQQQIGAKIASKEITPKVGGELSKELRGARHRLAQMAGAAQ